jgi:hypothetical protein
MDVAVLKWTRKVLHRRPATMLGISAEPSKQRVGRATDVPYAKSINGQLRSLMCATATPPVPASVLGTAIKHYRSSKLVPRPRRCSMISAECAVSSLKERGRVKAGFAGVLAACGRA